MKRLSLAASAAVLSLAFAGSTLAAPAALSENELDNVVAAGGSQTPSRDWKKDCGCGGGGDSVKQNGLLNVNNVLNGNKIHILSDNNIAVGVGVLAPGAVAYQF
jgi:hypothetical protein